ncbi:putative spermatogenesis-associated protein 31C2 [Mesoplodon densirostris]|uniref:putative spermatogenesis-associated protein 31C2 n=1 Tax=Mesoplodon densirostris TaxID=48708 RepID=UPI0028DC13E4|nr:putative spermatogenesis-associated protein 31C2 [Mesoplodon densirostris]
MNTSCRVSFLDPDTREVLEAHIKRFWVKHRWTLPLKVLKPINLFKSKKCQPSTVLQFATSPSATCVSGSHSTVKFAEFLEKPPRAHSGEKVIREESVPTLKRPLLVPSTVCKEIQSTLGAVPSIDYHGPSKASLTGQEGRPPSQSLTLSLVGRTWKSESVEWVKRDSLEPGPISAMVRNEPREESGGQASRDPCHRVTVMEVNLGSQSLRGEEAREAVEAKESPALQPQSSVILETKVLTKSQITNVHMRSLEAPGASRSFLLPRLSVFQHPGCMVDTAPGGVFLIVEISVPADAPDPDDNRNGPHPPSLSGPSTRGNAVTWGGGGRVSTGLLTPLVSPWSQALPLGPNSQGSLQNGQSSESGARTCGRGRYPEERVDRAGT